MPPKRANIGRKTRKSQQTARARSNESQEERETRNDLTRERNSRSRSARSNEEVEEANSDGRVRMQRNRSERVRREDNIDSRRIRAANAINLERAAFRYNPTFDYNLHKSVNIGEMSVVCKFCKALSFETEPPGMCCASGKVKLPPLQSPPEPLRMLIAGQSAESRHFLDKIQTYNSAFQMTSFGATEIVRDNFMPTFKVITADGISNGLTDSEKRFLFETTETNSNFQIKGQVYHSIGSLLPMPDEKYKFLQIYFLGNNDEEITVRSRIGENMRRHIIAELRELLHEHNELVRLFITSIEKLISDDHKIVIRADKTPAGEHPGRYNAPTVDEVAIIIVGEQFEKRDIVLCRRNKNLQRVSETHRFYDALQYPLLFCRGEEGYHLNIMQINPATG